MFAALHKSRQLYLITLDRLGDYMELLRVEMKIREQQLATRIAGFMLAMLFALLASVFLGLAIIISYWDSEHRVLAAWCVVLLYGAIAGISFGVCTKHYRSQPLTDTLRGELQHDIDVIKDNL